MIRRSVRLATSGERYAFQIDNSWILAQHVFHHPFAFNLRLLTVNASLARRRLFLLALRRFRYAPHFSSGHGPNGCRGLRRFVG